MSDDRASSSSAAPAAAASSSHYADRGQQQKENRQRFNRKRGQLLDDLLMQLDLNVYAFLSYVYYLEYAASTLNRRLSAMLIMTD
jgi:hypothetical protein